MSTFAVPSVVLGLMLAATGLGDDVDKGQAERKALEGKWVCQSSEVNGIKRGAEESRGQSFTFADGKCVYADAASGEVLSGTYRLDLGGKRRELAITQKVGLKEVTIRYIFERDGDTLRMCAHLLPGKGLPEEFSAPEGSKRVYLVLKWEKK